METFKEIALRQEATALVLEEHILAHKEGFIKGVEESIEEVNRIMELYMVAKLGLDREIGRHILIALQELKKKHE